MCVSGFACMSVSPLQSMSKIFFLFHIKRLTFQRLTQWRAHMKSTQPCQHCLWPFGKIINHPKSPLGLPANSYIPLHFSIAPVFLAYPTPSFSHFVFSPPLPSFTCTQRLSDPIARTVRFHKTASHIPLPWHHSPKAVIVRWLCVLVSVHFRVFVYTNVVGEIIICCRNSEVILKCSSKNHSGMTFQS